MTQGINTIERAREPRSQQLARRTRGLIAELQVRQADMAAVLGMTQTNLSRKVNGRIPMTPDEVQVLAELLDVSEAYLYGFTNDRSPGVTAQYRRSTGTGSVADLEAFRTERAARRDTGLPGALPGTGLPGLVELSGGSPAVVIVFPVARPVAS